MIVSVIPAIVKYSPFLKIDVFGINIQNDEITKKNKDRPKKIFRKNKGSWVVALWSFVSQMMTLEHIEML